MSEKSAASISMDCPIGTVVGRANGSGCLAAMIANSPPASRMTNVALFAEVVDREKASCFGAAREGIVAAIRMTKVGGPYGNPLTMVDTSI
ncbi:hypothetical protein [Sphingobium cupriresistens]|uniref:hypothetical protein n=1 Tax=Sphingobium cupriresistens TaxID=1132417 RepID=UPI0014705AB3|nr:hypothetical protein [Sphingobium cupriresistens]